MANNKVLNKNRESQLFFDLRLSISIKYSIKKAYMNS